MWVRVEKAGGLGHVGERAVAIVAVQNVLSEAGAEDVVEAVIIVVTNAHSAGPANRVQPRFICYIGKRAVAIVFVKTIGCTCGRAFQAGAGEDKNVHPSVVVVVEKGTSTTGRLEDVLLLLDTAVYDWRV